MGDTNNNMTQPPVEAGYEGVSNASRKLLKKRRIRVPDLKEAKSRKEKWGMLTCYDAVSARVFDQAMIPCLLVGDSAAQMVYGYKSTIPVTMDELIPLARAVASNCERALVIADLPFGSYQESPKAALEASTRFMKEAQVHGVKLEGGREFAEHVRLLSQSGIPVMAHVGFTPQNEHSIGGFKVQGRGQDAIDKLVKDAKILEEAGAFACVLELVPREAGRAVTEALQIPTVGIGAGPDCDAQILVWHDMAGFNAPKATGYLDGVEEKQDVNTLELTKTPKFVKRYANLSEILYKAARTYYEDVATGKYPAEEHCYK